MYTQTTIYVGDEALEVRAVVTETRDRERRLVTPIEVRAGSTWVRISNDAQETAEAALIAAYYPEAEAAGDWRIP
jgi:hypothetical protein